MRQHPLERPRGRHRPRSRTQQLVLDALRNQRFLTIAEIAQAVGVTPGQVRAAVHALERRGLVSRNEPRLGWELSDRYRQWVWTWKEDRRFRQGMPGRGRTVRVPEPWQQWEHKIHQMAARIAAALARRPD